MIPLNPCSLIYDAGNNHDQENRQQTDEITLKCQFPSEAMIRSEFVYDVSEDDAEKVLKTYYRKALLLKSSNGIELLIYYHNLCKYDRLVQKQFQRIILDGSLKHSLNNIGIKVSELIRILPKNALKLILTQLITRDPTTLVLDFLTNNVHVIAAGVEQVSIDDFVHKLVNSTLDAQEVDEIIDSWMDEVFSEIFCLRVEALNKGQKWNIYIVINEKKANQILSTIQQAVGDANHHNIQRMMRKIIKGHFCPTNFEINKKKYNLQNYIQKMQNDKNLIDVNFYLDDKCAKIHDFKEFCNYLNEGFQELCKKGIADFSTKLIDNVALPDLNLHITFTRISSVIYYHKRKLSSLSGSLSQALM